VTTQSFTTQVELKWSEPLKVPMSHLNLSQTLSSALRGIDQAARGEGTVIDVSKLPTDDDE
jgi:hypothetical protein